MRRIVNAQVGNFVYVTTKQDQAVKWLGVSRFPFNVWFIAPDDDRAALGALDIQGWQFFLCSDDEIAEAVSLSLPSYLDSRMRKLRP